MVFAQLASFTLASGFFVSLLAHGAPANVQELKQQAQEKRETAIAEFQNKQQEAEEMAAQKREEAMQRLKVIRDEQKRMLAQKLAGNLDRVNQNWVNHWLKVLDNLTQVLIKMESRADKLETLGFDVANAREMIEVAHAAIADAQAALNEQAGKVYEIEFTDENNLGDGIQEAIQELRADLAATREEVIAAIEATSGALSSLKSSAGEGDEDGESEESEPTEADEVDEGAEVGN